MPGQILGEVYIYGMTSFNEIEDEFFRQLHPKLSSKGMRLTGKILKGVLKTAIKVDLNGDGKEDATVNSQIPEIYFPEYLTNIDAHILIFDDLERCKINFENVLGYINHFVEHQGFKVIILAHEEEIEKRAKALEIEYKIIKEKLIGKTFQVTPNLESAIEDFIGKLMHDGAREFLIANKDQISVAYALSGFENLRILKQSLWDFERIYEALPGKALKKDELVRKILALSLALSLEVRAGKLSPTEILRLQPDWLSAAILEANKNKVVEKTAPQEFVEKYKSLEPHRPIPSAVFWSEYLGKGVIDRAALESSIDNSAYFVSEVTPNWVKLWYYMDLCDEEFERVLKAVIEEFEGGKYTEIGVIKHVVGMFLWLSKIELISLEKKQIIELARENVDKLKLNGALSEESDLGEQMGGRMGYAGLGFHGNDLPEFRELSDYVRKVQLDAKQESMPQAADNLIEIMKSDVGKFARMIYVSNSDEQVYCSSPIFKYADADKFIANLLKIKPKDRRVVAYALEERYKFESSCETLMAELDWLKKVGSLLRAEADQKKGKLSGYALSEIGNEVDQVIGRLESKGNNQCDTGLAS